MRLIDETFRARLSRDTLTTCLCWTLVRKDSLTVGLTDHDQAVVRDGVLHEPGIAVEAGRLELAGGLRPGRAAAAGALTSDAISEADLEAGLWNGARVHIHRTDWQQPEHFVLVWTGYLSEVIQTQGAFEAELISIKADLERPLGRSYSSRCDAKLGDARCGLSSVDGQMCDKRFETCRDTFDNVQNFRGFPHLPGPDFVLSGPAATGNDGGRR
ncbi:DUF2163 domain-containing protein [Henriciella sp. AS95]|uniref:DUF2163 domain-containing protein n=1 Tax=Henriciella sp. AS95 TaxID=3135782 RepID=UPI003171B7A8